MIFFELFNLNFTIFEWISLIMITSLGGFMRGFAGFGTTLMMVPIFSLIMPPVEAVFIGLSIDVIAMAPMVPNAARNADWRRILPIFIGSVAATPVGVYILYIMSDDAMRIMIAILLMGSAMLMLSGWTYRGKQNLPLSFGVGFVSGTTGTAAAIGGPPIAVYMLALGLTANKTRATLNTTSFIKEGISAISILYITSFEIRLLIIIIALLPFMLIFTWVGSSSFRKSDETSFKKFILRFLLIIGVTIFTKTIFFN
ncbi:MAG: hypothetical protein CMM67_08020 [Rhodospirillaceae bacterium]|nr:hypothetical protein [Rhodospirillaceae bacterium]OUT77168.1 MAG: hypothetical protein CBB83_08190 [Rhodospirillaceae bacterium TMED23]|tara:strand:- start:14678 stop:15445 length:768 start_codon:yes stop_codon:yes gene_type:complete